MVLEGCESGDDLALESEGWDSIGDAFLGFRDYFKDRLAQTLEGGPFRLLYLS